MRKFKQYLEDIIDDFYFEMSKHRRNAYDIIKNQMTILLVHLIAVEESKKGDDSYTHHLKEINDYKKIIQSANQKKNTNKAWFKKDAINDIAEDYILIAIKKFEKKFGRKPKKEYNSLKDFMWFNLFE